MKRNSLILSWLVLVILFFFGQSWAQCPEDPNDNGVCDTLYVEIWPEDDWVWTLPFQVRFPIRVTHDISDPSIDSLIGLVIPLRYTSSNPTANITVDPARNKCGSQDVFRPYHNVLYDLNLSIFRDLPSMEDPQEPNWMMDLSDMGGGQVWDSRILDLSHPGEARFSVVATGAEDQRFPEGSRILVATITFTIYDTTTICIDTCFWPPSGRLTFARFDAQTYIPRHFMPFCQEINMLCNMPPQFYNGPGDQWHHSVGHYNGGSFEVGHVCGIMTAVSADFVGEGVENVTVFLNGSLPAYSIEGHVEYDVVDSCQSGGTVTIIGQSNNGTAYHEFTIYLPNEPPHLTLSDTWRALAGYTMLLKVTGVDPDGDIMGDIELDAFWYEGDSLKPPANPPSYEPGNPGIMTWAFAESDTGVWICLFSLSDSCGAEGKDTLAIGVGLIFCGDFTGDGEINVGDLVCLVSYLYRQGFPPEPLCKGDANGDGSVDVADVVLLVNYLYRSGSAPCFDCCAEGS